MLVDINGTAVHIDRVDYPEKRSIRSEGTRVLRIYFYGGSYQDIPYGYNREKRDRDFKRVIKAVNILKYE